METNINNVYQLIYVNAKNKHKHIFSRVPLRMPRLDTVLMIEEIIAKKSSELSVRALWLQLPKQVMWQTFLAALDYLEYSGKIELDAEKKLCWVFIKKPNYKSHHFVVLSEEEIKPFFNPFLS
jgi:uncharacterized membrane protein